jgi:hypothetical protein
MVPWLNCRLRILQLWQTIADEDFECTAEFRAVFETAALFQPAEYGRPTINGIV